VGHDVHTLAGLRAAGEPSAARDVERDGFALVAAGEEEPAFFVERDPSGALTAVGPARDHPRRGELDDEGGVVPGVRIRAAAHGIDDERLGSVRDPDATGAHQRVALETESLDLFSA